MFDIPEPAISEQPPALALIQQQIGGSGKSFTGQLLADAAYRSERELGIFENDGQRFYDGYGPVTRLLLPPSEEVVHDPIADVRAHSPLSTALSSLSDDGLLLYDCCAANLNRHTFAIQYTNLPERVLATGRHCLILIPSSARPDIAREALTGYEVWRDLLPSPHRVIPVISRRDGTIDHLPAGHDLLKLVKSAADGVLLMPRTPMAIINDIRRSGLRLCDLADMRNPLSTPEIAARIGQDPTIVEMMRRCAGDMIAKFDPQLQRLGFPLGL